MKEPISKLPWNNDNDIEVLLDADNGGVGHEFYEQDVKYIVQACNNFPKAIELLHKATGSNYLSQGLVDELHEEINTFLTQLEE